MALEPEVMKTVMKLYDYLSSGNRTHYFRIVALLVRKDLKVKYRGSVLGYLWSMLNPLMLMIIITLVFGRFSRGIENFSIYVLAGILCWNMISGGIQSGTGSIVNGAPLLRKVKLPIWVLPAVPLGTFSTNLALALIPFSVLFAANGLSPHWELLLFPIVLLLLCLFVFGITLALSSLNVIFRDVAHVLEPVLSLVFYGTPIIYDRHDANIPEQLKGILALNPFTHFIEAFRACLMGYYSESLPQRILGLAVMSFISVLLGTLVYKRMKTKVMYNV